MSLYAIEWMSIANSQGILASGEEEEYKGRRGDLPHGHLARHPEREGN